MSTQVGAWIYAGVPYVVAEKEGRRYIGLQGQIVAALVKKGADMKLLNDIGDQDPDDVMAALFDSIPKVDTA